MRYAVRSALAGLSVLLLAQPSQATNGYFTHGVGAESKGMAGTGVGSDAGMSSIIVASNPALSVFSDDSWEFGMGLFSPRRSYSASQSELNGQFGSFSIGAGNFDSSSNYFFIPNVSKNWHLDDDRALTFLFYGRGGMNTDWENANASASFDPDGPGPADVGTFPGPFGAGNAGVDLSQAFITLNYAAKASENFAWGVGPIFAIQMFEANGVGSFAGYTRTFAASGGTTLPTALTNNGKSSSTGFGFGAGLWWGITDTLSAGLSYQSTLSMGEFDDYADLFAQSGGFDIPSSIKLGLSFKASDALRVNFDIENTHFSEVDSVGNPMAYIADCPTAGLGGTDVESCLGGARGAGFGWDDMTTYKFGVEWRANSMYTWRFGYSQGDQPIQAADVVFNILAPGVMEQHFTVGLTRHGTNSGDWIMSLMYAPENTVSGANMMDPTQTIDLKMHQFELEVAYHW